MFASINVLACSLVETLLLRAAKAIFFTSSSADSNQSARTDIGFWPAGGSHMTLLALQQLTQEGAGSCLEVGAGQQDGSLRNEAAAGNSSQGRPLCVCSCSLCNDMPASS